MAKGTGRNEVKDAVAEQKKHWVRITRACNNRCLFCLDRENQNGSIFPVEMIVADLKKGLSGGAKRAVLSGGDPTVHPQLCEIIAKAKSLGYEHVQIITNGRMLAYEKFAKDLKKAGLDEVTLSLHSHIEEDFESMSGIKGSYHQALAGLLNAKKQGFIVNVDIVINKINYQTLKETIQFYIRLGVSEFDLLYPIPFGDAWKNRSELFFDPEKTHNYLRDAFGLSKNKNLFIWTNRLPAQYLEGFEDLIQNPVKINDEVKGMHFGLARLVERGIPMSCKGERCRYCFMSGFCADLDLLLAKKSLPGRADPPCCGSVMKGRKPTPVFRMDKDFTLESFTHFFIGNRYFVKSLRCRECRYFETCDGAWIGDVRKNGFSILKPKIKPKKRIEPHNFAGRKV
jgi:MoaA/NifB/PqqE/SkfB family radical SAM enzyme